MDPALLKERERFKARSLQLPAVEKRKVREDDSSVKSRPHKKAKPPPKPKGEFDYKTMAGTSQYRFGILAKIVKHMKQRHQEGDTHPLTIEEILDETNQLDATQRQKHWLVTEALTSNPKIDVVEGDKYKFKPKYKLKDRKSLLRLLDKQDRDGLGGIYLEDVEESLPNSAKALKALGDQVIYVTRPDKKKVLFYNDKSYHFNVDIEIQKMWRSVAVDGIDEGKIEDYLQKQGITSMQDIEVARAPKQKRRGGRRNKKTFKSHNEHMADVFQDYSEGSKK